jgi:hypothetical protein
MNLQHASGHDDRDYDIMQGEMSCAENITDLTAYGWACNITLTELTKEQNYDLHQCKGPALARRKRNRE